MRSIRTVVFPEPAPASTIKLVSSSVTMRRRACASLSVFLLIFFQLSNGLEHSVPDVVPFLFETGPGAFTQRVIAAQKAFLPGGSERAVLNDVKEGIQQGVA